MVLVKLTKKIKNPIVIEGFPGFGLVGTIVTEFLLDHLKCEEVGVHYFDKLWRNIIDLLWITW